MGPDDCPGCHAGEKLKRRAQLVELDPRYCDVIVKRWEGFTGLKAVRTDK